MRLLYSLLEPALCHYDFNFKSDTSQRHNAINAGRILLFHREACERHKNVDGLRIHLSMKAQAPAKSRISRNDGLKYSRYDGVRRMRTSYLCG